MVARSPQQRAAFEATHAQIERIHQQARTQILGSLTPQHRTQLGALIGQFAIAPVQDRHALEKQIDAMLSPREAQAILTTAAGEHTAMHSIMQAASAQFEATLTPEERTAMQARMDKMKAMHADRPERTPDAGSILLHAALGSDHTMHGGGPPPGAA